MSSTNLNSQDPNNQYQSQSTNQSINQVGSLYNPSSSVTNNITNEKPPKKIKHYKKETKKYNIKEIFRIFCILIVIGFGIFCILTIDSGINYNTTTQSTTQYTTQYAPVQRGGGLMDNIPKSVYILIIIYIIILLLLFIDQVLSFISISKVNDILNNFEYYLNPSFQDDPGFISISDANLNIYIYDIISTIIIILFIISYILIKKKKDEINQIINIKYIIGISFAIVIWLILTTLIIYYCYIKKYIKYKDYIQEPLYYFDSYITSQLIILPSFINDPILTIKYNILTYSLASCIYTIPTNTTSLDDKSDNKENIIFVQQKNMSDVHQWIIDKIIPNFNDYVKYIKTNKNINDNDKTNYINDIINKILVSINLFIFFHENIGISLQNSTQNEIYNIANIKGALSVFITKNNLINQIDLLLGTSNTNRSISKYIRLNKPHISDHTTEFSINNNEACGKLTTSIDNIKYSTKQINIINSILDKFDTFDTIKKYWIETYKAIFIGYGIIPYNILAIIIIPFILVKMNIMSYIMSFNYYIVILVFLVLLLILNSPCIYLLMIKNDG